MANVAKSAAAGAAAGSSFGPIGTVIGGIGGSALSAIGNFFSNKSNQKAQNKLFEKQSAFAKREREAQQNWIENMYEKNNTYNSPAAQMARFKEAGLNPDLIYGQLGDSTASMPSPASQASTPSAGAFTNVNPLQSIGDSISGMAMQKAQIDAIKANTNKTNQETKQLDIQNHALPDSLRQQLTNMREQGKLTAKEIEKTNVVIQNIQTNTQSLQESIKSIQADVLLKNDELDWRKISHAMDSQRFIEEMRAIKLKYQLDEQQFEHLSKMLPRLLSEKDLSIQALANQVYLSDQDVAYQKQYGSKESDAKHSAIMSGYAAQKQENQTREIKASGAKAKALSDEKFSWMHYTDSPSIYGKMVTAASDAMSILKGLLK